MLRFSILLFLLFWQCQPSQIPETYRFDPITVIQFPANAPPAFPQSFFPETSKFIQSSEFKTSHIHTKEAFLLLETEESFADIQKRIELRASQGDWKLIEKNTKDLEVFYLLEGYIKKSLSISLTSHGKTNQMRFYFKKHSTY
ncbi:hypothetical protein LEP1GSC202_3184 [Leptospira yanagawae serovar Saopaulo str. Sao Paulo = ATCC 700523]|uniref:Uncharacterized protein n=1 Tax=Leptospira yanagawae serovar Saopaulo str. Sao Paulo = ATCC 700523 TaxID=1249483 RepID=A0A5E8HC09_9LEPT|nr:hypothetical protein [Leptospira yanagawae]EOQ88110.1 hypothetical protein LEP1GSC202_3184 [Leptospira yanagawae serovar Saopaulo str. Sao Paulo = ATCC 700523]